MILGAGKQQLPAIEKAIELELETIVVDPYPNSIGKSNADYSFEADLLNIDEVLSIARNCDIDGVMTFQSELPVPAVGKINDELNLNGVSHEVATKCCNKGASRQAYKKEGIPQPDFRIVNNLNEAEKAVKQIGTPCVFKAPDRSGSRGIIKVDTKDKVEKAFHEALRFSRESKIVVEEYIEGLEFGAQTFSVGGECVRILLHNDQLSFTNMVPIGHSFPFRFFNSEKQNTIKRIIKNAVESLGIGEGPANVDLILEAKSNEIKILEIEPRGGATCLTELIEYHTGVDWLKATIFSALNEKVELENSRNQPVAASIITSPKDGIYQGFNQNSEPGEHDIVDFQISVYPGDKVRKFQNGSHRIGKAIAFGESAVAAEENVQLFLENLTIEVE